MVTEIEIPDDILNIAKEACRPSLSGAVWVDDDQHIIDVADAILKQVAAHKQRIKELEYSYNGTKVVVKNQQKTIDSLINFKTKEYVWHPIRSAPKDGTEFLACWDHQGKIIRIINYSRLWKCWYNNEGLGSRVDQNPTHWALLPSIEFLEGY